jgi:hypothetical protein
MPVTTPQQARKNGIIARSIIGRILSPATVAPIAGHTEALIRKECRRSRGRHLLSLPVVDNRSEYRSA